MRKWIKLFEYHIPAFVDYVTDELVDEMIRTGKFVDHGGNLEDERDADVFDAGNEAPIIADKPFDEIRHTPEFRKLLHDVLLRNAKWSFESLTQGNSYNGLPALSEATPIYRCIAADENFDADAIGVYWSLDYNQSLRFAPREKDCWMFVAKLGDVQVNWPETVRSRLDLANGADEEEIQLRRGTTVQAQLIRMSAETSNAPKRIKINGVLIQSNDHSLEPVGSRSFIA